MPVVTRADIERAVRVLRAGGLVAFPTETVYGLGAAARDPAALARLYAVKGRPVDHPVIVHLAGADRLGDWAATVPAAAAALAERFWPGPLTLVLDRAASVPDAVTGGRATVGLRVPDQPVALALLAAFGDGIAAPSANRFGQVSPTTAAHVRAGLGADVDLLLDGGPCRIGVESTIVDLSDPTVPRLLRAGGVPAEALAETLGALPETDRGPARAPGMLAAHYAPRARVVLARDADELAALAGVAAARGERVGAIVPELAAGPPRGAVVLSRPSTPDAYARELYEALHRADELDLDVVLAIAPDPRGIGLAVHDRLLRAAAGRRS